MPNDVTCNNAPGAGVAKVLRRPYLENFQFKEKTLDDLAAMIAEAYCYLRDGDRDTIKCYVDQSGDTLVVTVDISCYYHTPDDYYYYGLRLGDDDMYEFWIHEGKTWLISGYDNAEYDVPDPDVKQVFIDDSDRDYFGQWEFDPPCKTRYQRGRQI